MSPLLFITLLGGIVLGAWLLGRHLPARSVDLSIPSVLYSTWVAHAAAFENKRNLHLHIIKHAQELTDEIEGDGSYETWSASMHNLLAIYDCLHGVNPDVELKLERMTAKFLQDPVTHVPPPGPVPKRIVEAARGPKIEVRRRESRSSY